MKMLNFFSRVALVLCCAVSPSLAQISAAETRAGTTAQDSPKTVVTITEYDGTVRTDTDQLVELEQAQVGAAAICSGAWTGNTNSIGFTVTNQTTINNFKITFLNLGNCTMVTVTTNPVIISGNSFTVNYNIPTISTGSLTGTFSADGNSVSGSFTYRNFNCGTATATGSWSGTPNVPCTPPPTADFTGSPTSGTKPLAVQFTDASTGSINSWSWDFGDGQTSTQQNPSHMYTNAGTYTVALTVNGPGGSNMKTRNNYIVVNEPAPVADFTGSPTSGVKPLTVQFTDASTGSINSWSWNFGDGQTSTQQNPSHTYANAGTYTVALIVTGPGGSNTKTRSNYITVTEPAPVADFTGSPTSGVKPLTVQFTDASTGSINSWSWNFGDGQTSTQQNPSHTYANAGTYTVALIVTGPGGSNTKTRSNYIVVNEPAPVADFTGSPTSGTKPLAVQFTDASAGSINSWSWDFGDGQTSTQQNPSHTYANAGTYTVALTVTGPGGSNTKTRSNYITVTEPAPVADFTGSPTSGVKPLTVQFTDASTGSINSRSWNFGDGQTSTQQNPSHTYANAGTYTVALTVTGPGGSNTKTRSNYITVTEPAPVADFTGSPTSGVKPLTVQFTEASSGSINSWSWNFGDGQTSTQQNPSHTYANAGTYTVALTVTGPGGSNTKTRSNYITVTEPAPVADFTGSPTSGVKPLTVQFTDASSGSINSRSWNFGDGGTSTLQNPSYTYLNPGMYAVSLTVTGPGGSNIKTRPNYITVTPPVSVDERDSREIPKAFALYPNYPNPFNPSTIIAYDLPKSAYVELKVYDMLGNEVQTLVRGERAPGKYRVQFDSKGLPGGMYFYRLRAGERVEVKKMVIVR